MLDIAVIVVAVIGLSHGQGYSDESCVDTEGELWWGCGSYGLCSRGRYQQIDCVNGTVYNRAEQRCTQIDFAQFPCNRVPDCSAYVSNPGHRLPETDTDGEDGRPPCSYYYTCTWGIFGGYQACGEWEVYSEGEQRCKQPEDVPPPCGSQQPGQDRQPQIQGPIYVQGQDGIHPLNQGQGQNFAPGQGQGGYQGQGQGGYQGQGQGGNQGQGGYQSQGQGRYQGQFQGANQGQGQGGHGGQSPYPARGHQGHQGHQSNQNQGPPRGPDAWARR